MGQTRFHPKTGDVLRRDARMQTLSVGSLSREVEVPGWYLKTMAIPSIRALNFKR